MVPLTAERRQTCLGGPTAITRSSSRTAMTASFSTTAAGAEEPRPFRPWRLCRLDDAGSGLRLGYIAFRRLDAELRVAPLMLRHPPVTNQCASHCSCRSAITRRWYGGCRAPSRNGAIHISPSCRSGAQPIWPAAPRQGPRGTMRVAGRGRRPRSVIIEPGDRFFDRTEKPRVSCGWASPRSRCSIEPGIRELATAVDGRRRPDFLPGPTGRGS